MEPEAKPFPTPILAQGAQNHSHSRLQSLELSKESWKYCTRYILAEWGKHGGCWPGPGGKGDPASGLLYWVPQGQFL